MYIESYTALYLLPTVIKRLNYVKYDNRKMIYLFKAYEQIDCQYLIWDVG